MPIKYLLGHVEQPKDLRITNRVEDAEPVFAGIYDMPCAQNSELLRESALFCVQPGAQIIHSNLSIAQLVHNADPQWVGERFEEFSLEEAEVGGVLRFHKCLYISIHRAPTIPNWTSLLLQEIFYRSIRSSRSLI